MKQKIMTPSYLSIAKDIAIKIVEGELKEGQRILGRSTLAATYNTSSETIRRALHLLMDMKVVDIKPQSGIYIRSVQSAKQYLNSLQNENQLKQLLESLDDMKKQYEDLNERMLSTVKEIVTTRYSYQTSDDYFPTYRILIPQQSHLCLKMIGESRFWQNTGATIIAIQRKNNMILSPGPYACFYGGDTLILVGTIAQIDAAKNYVMKEETNDSI